MSGLKGNGVVTTSLPPPRPKSPPELYGRRRELAKVQVLEREIGFLEEELKSIEGLQLASRSCKEVADFVTVNADPLITTTRFADHVAFGNGCVEEYRVSRYRGFAAVVCRASANVTRVILAVAVADCRRAAAVVSHHHVGIANAVRN
ncbi:hypothetical protein CASFOL_032395 [Castilleja foliolosa]|uniref:G protein gamma domain-containing protein n=1 Tax=Castilleja foliolosa TaxID=1961234 RepID=A0ABD3C1X5_9LAMI